ncbi:MAG TPA: ATP-binding protein [Burkholderiales bacterium]|nr:ATP-binding protein [Burkholderiales bacterium]
MSIRKNLLLALLSTLLLLGLATSAATYFAARREANELFDYQLRQMALSLRDQTLQSQNTFYPGFDYDFIVQVWNPGGSLVYLSNQNILLPQSKFGFNTVAVNGEDWRIFTMNNDGKIVQVALPLSLRSDRAAAIALRILIPIVASIPLFALLIWLLVGWGLEPLGSIARAIAKRAPSSLQPLPEQGLPDEVQPMVAQLNSFLARLAEAIETQRRFTADAAHELRTPLAALQLQLQVLERAQTLEDRSDALAQLKAGVRRAHRMVEQLLTLARLEPEAAQTEVTPVRLDRLAAESVAEIEPLAAAKPVEMRLGRMEPVIIPGREKALRALLDNLVENAIRYTPSGGRVIVDACADAEGPLLAVTDNGPGIPAEERERVFDRFYRLPGSAAPGSGLGLAIVKNIADSHGAKVDLAEGVGGVGLTVRVRFPTGQSVPGNSSPGEQA